jgi:hypothetical protein
MKAYIFALVAMSVLCIHGQGICADQESQRNTASAPQVPFEDSGACPFEGCVYREWTAKSKVAIRTERHLSAPVAFRLKEGEKVTAITGVVVTIKAGQVQFLEPRTLSTSNGPLHIMPGQALYLLTYQGEGFTKVWFNGRLYQDVDATDFLNGVCEIDPKKCAGKVIEKSQTEWWVQIRSKSGKVGWTNEPNRFGGKDALE